jgi:hypothetical protein
MKNNYMGIFDRMRGVFGGTRGDVLATNKSEKEQEQEQEQEPRLSGKVYVQVDGGYRLGEIKQDRGV